MRRPFATIRFFYFYLRWTQSKFGFHTFVDQITRNEIFEWRRTIFDLVRRRQVLSKELWNLERMKWSLRRCRQRRKGTNHCANFSMLTIAATVWLIEFFVFCMFKNKFRRIDWSQLFKTILSPCASTCFIKIVSHSSSLALSHHFHCFLTTKFFMHSLCRFFFLFFILLTTVNIVFYALVANSAYSKYLVTTWKLKHLAHLIASTVCPT